VLRKCRVLNLDSQFVRVDDSYCHPPDRHLTLSEQRWRMVAVLRLPILPSSSRSAKELCIPCGKSGSRTRPTPHTQLRLADASLTAFQLVSGQYGHSIGRSFTVHYRNDRALGNTTNTTTTLHFWALLLSHHAASALPSAPGHSAGSEGHVAHLLRDTQCESGMDGAHLLGLVT